VGHNQRLHNELLPPEGQRSDARVDSHRFPVDDDVIGLTMKAGLCLAHKTHPLIVMLVGQVLDVLFIFVSLSMPNVWLFLLFYGILFGLSA
jgi:hypothetical protein